MIFSFHEDYLFRKKEVLLESADSSVCGLHRLMEIVILEELVAVDIFTDATLKQH